MEEMSFKGFSIFSSGHHLLIWLRAIGGTLLCKYFEIRPLAKDRCRLKIFYFLALAAILFSGAEPLWPSWIFDPHNFSLFRSRSHPVAKEQVSVQSDLRFEKRCRKLIFKTAAVMAILDFLSAHLAILNLISALMLLIKFRLNWIIEEMSKI